MMGKFYGTEKFLRRSRSAFTSRSESSICRAATEAIAASDHRRPFFICCSRLNLSLRSVSRRTWLICNRVSADSRCRLALRALATVSAESDSDFATYLVVCVPRT